MKANAGWAVICFLVAVALVWAGDGIFNQINVGSTATFEADMTLGNAITDIITMTGLPTMPTNGTPSGVTATAAGQFLIDTSPVEVCVSTAAGTSSWVSLTKSTGTLFESCKD